MAVPRGLLRRTFPKLDDETRERRPRMTGGYGSGVFRLAREADYWLVTAAFNGDLPLLRQALTRGGDPNVLTINAWSPLIWLASRSLVGHEPVACAEALLSAGADIRYREPTGWDALSHACAAGHAELAALFVERGAEVNPPDGTASPLHAAFPSLAIVATLIAAGADPRRVEDGATPWQVYEAGWIDPEDGDPDRDQAMWDLLSGEGRAAKR